MDSKLKTFLKFIRIEHTIFDLPFVFIGVELALIKMHISYFPILKVILIVAAAILARISGMTLNRLMDLPLDRENPRTKNRELVTGKIKVSEARAIFIISSILFVLVAFSLNTLAGMLSPVVLLSFYLYPLTKRLPAISHFVLGLSIGIIVIAGYIGISASFPNQWQLYGYSIFTALWIASFDVKYQDQDREFDKTKGIKSIPVLLNGKIILPILMINLASSAILLLSSLGLVDFILNLVSVAIMLVSIPMMNGNDIDTIFKRFYLPIPFIILLGLGLQLIPSIAQLKI